MAKVEPGRDPQMAERTRGLNLVFALSSIALLLAFSWMIYADYNREWKKYQLEFNKLDVTVTEEQIEKAGAKVDARKKEAIEAQLAQGQQEVLARAEEVRVAYVRPAQLDDQLEVTVALEHIGRAQFTLAQQVLCGGQALVRGSVNLACVGSERLRPMRVPDALRAVLVQRGLAAAAEEEV